MFVATVDKNHISIEGSELITSGSVKTNFVLFNFSEDWDGLGKVAVFQTKKSQIPVFVEDATKPVAIPWEVMAFPNETISVGVYGIRDDDPGTATIDEEIVLPTIWTTLGKVVQGVIILTPPPTAPTKDAFEQLLDYIQSLTIGNDERLSDGTLFVSMMGSEPTIGFDYPVTYKNFVGLKPVINNSYLGLLMVGDDSYISTVTITTIDAETDDIQVRFDSLTKLAGGIGGVPYVSLLVAPHETYSAHDVETIVGKSLEYSAWNRDAFTIIGEPKFGKEFTAYFLYDGEQLNPTLQYYGVFVCDEYDPDVKYEIKATLKNAVLVGTRTEPLNSFLTFFKLDTLPTTGAKIKIPFKAAVGIMPQWLNTRHSGFMVVDSKLYLLDFTLDWILHDTEEFEIGVNAVTKVGGSDEPPFLVFKDQTINTPSELQTVIGHRPYYGCIHAINTRILGMAFTNDIVWISYRLISGTYYLDLVTADGHCEAWSSADFSAVFSSVSSTKFLTEEELDLAEGTTFVGYFISPPEVNSRVSMSPDWFIGKKPTVGTQYRGKARNNVNKWWDMVINVVGTFDNEGTTMYTVDVVSVDYSNEISVLSTSDIYTILGETMPGE